MLNDTVETRRSTVDRATNGQWAEGNPGRKPGSKNKVSNEALAAIRSLKDEAIEKLRLRVQRDDWNALQFVLERYFPKGRTVELDDTSPSGIATALAEGHLTPDEARVVAATIANLAAIGELPEIRQRLQELLDAAAEKKKPR